MTTPAKPGAQTRPAEGERCGVCGGAEAIRLRCLECGKAIGAECVLPSELETGRCSICALLQTPAGWKPAP